MRIRLEEVPENDWGKIDFKRQISPEEIEELFGYVVENFDGILNIRSLNLEDTRILHYPRYEEDEGRRFGISRDKHIICGTIEKPSNSAKLDFEVSGGLYTHGVGRSFDYLFLYKKDLTLENLPVREKRLFTDIKAIVEEYFGKR